MPGQGTGLRVLMVAARASLYTGGVETHMHELAPRLARAGLDVTVLSTDPERRLPREERADGVRVLRVPSWPANRDWYFAPGIFRTIVSQSWDLIHCQGY